MAIAIRKRRILATFGLNRTTLRAIQPKLHSIFCTLFLKIALSTAELISFGHFRAAKQLPQLDYYLWGAVGDICYADKPETIDALKDKILEAIVEIHLHTIDKVLKNWTDRVGYCMVSRGSHFHY